MTPQNTRVVRADDPGIAEAAGIIGSGGCVAVPTETVYGLAADATNGEAVARIYEAKGRPSFNPLIIHVSALEHAQEFAVFDDAARDFAMRYWPGPLTLVLPARQGSPVAPLATAGLPTIALRVPAHRAIRALLTACGRPLAAPSANASGRVSPTTAAHVLASLNGRIPLVIDDGATPMGLESTIVAVDANGRRLLRPGPIAAEELRLVHTHADGIEAPGQLASHYRPEKPMRLNCTSASADTWLIGFGSIRGDVNLSPVGDLVEAAARLFACLHEADASGRASIAVAPIPFAGLGAAINDRLSRAAA